MRGIPKVLGTYADIVNLAKGLPVLQAAAFFEAIAEETWELLKISPDDRGAVAEIINARLTAEDMNTQRQQARATNIIRQIALRTEADEFGRDARKIKEVIEDLELQLADHRAAGFEEKFLAALVAEHDRLQSLFGTLLIKHQQWMAGISKLRKKMKDEEV